jgi:DNA-binding NarL/FixJ family response regulator
LDHASSRGDSNPAASTVPLTSVVAVDDHRAFSEALGMAIDLQPDLRLAGVATTAEDGLGLVATEQPDVVLVDVMLPDADGIEVARRVHEVSPATQVVVLTARADIAVMARAASAGAAGFISKTRPVAEILATIRAAVEGEVSLDRSTLTALLARLEGGDAGWGTVQAQLTPRELEVLSLLGDGLSVHAMASRLQVSVHTCRGSVKSILGKLGAHSQLEAVVKASRQGLLPSLR